MKNIVVVITEPPNGRTAEKLRMCVGLTLADDRITALLIDDGVYSGLGLDKDLAGFEIDKHLETLGALGMDVIAHDPSIEARGLALSRFGVKAATDVEVAELLQKADITIA